MSIQADARGRLTSRRRRPEHQLRPASSADKPKSRHHAAHDRACRDETVRGRNEIDIGRDVRQQWASAQATPRPTWHDRRAVSGRLAAIGNYRRCGRNQRRRIAVVVNGLQSEHLMSAAKSNHQAAIQKRQPWRDRYRRGMKAPAMTLRQDYYNIAIMRVDENEI